MPHEERVTDTPRGALVQIGQVADRTRLSLRTIRFYEENGLVNPTARSKGGSGSTARTRSPASR